MKNSIQFEFVNSFTGNIIAYLTLSKEMDKEQRDQRLESKKAELAVSNKINIALIYWQDHEFALA